MKYTINTENKTIEIEDATIEEVVKLAKKYKKYRVISAMNITYPWYPIHPYWQPWGTAPYLEPYYITTTDLVVSTSTDGTGDNHTLIIN